MPARATRRSSLLVGGGPRGASPAFSSPLRRTTRCCVAVVDVQGPGDRSCHRAAESVAPIALASRGEVAAQPVIDLSRRAPRRSGVRPASSLRSATSLGTTAAGGPSIDSKAIEGRARLGEVCELTAADAGRDRQSQQQHGDAAEAAATCRAALARVPGSAQSHPHRLPRRLGDLSSHLGRGRVSDGMEYAFRGWCPAADRRSRC